MGNTFPSNVFENYSLRFRVCTVSFSSGFCLPMAIDSFITNSFKFLAFKSTDLNNFFFHHHFPRILLKYKVLLNKWINCLRKMLLATVVNACYYKVKLYNVPTVYCSYYFHSYNISLYQNLVHF